MKEQNVSTQESTCVVIRCIMITQSLCLLAPLSICANCFPGRKRHPSSNDTRVGVADNVDTSKNNLRPVSTTAFKSSASAALVCSVN